MPFPDDEIFDTAGSCSVALSTNLTEGPCYYEHNVGPDIAAGLTGVPMQLSLRLIDGDCQPLPNHVVEVWHCDARGLYSGDTSRSADADRFGIESDCGINLGTAFCTEDDEFAVSTTFFRGTLINNDRGRVDFATCFPGWYAGRTLHIHVAVSDPDGERRIVSQLTVPDELVTEIFTTHELYLDRGDQDTPLGAGTDMFFPATGFEEFLMTVERNDDGSMLVYHNIQVV
ncbi:MAG: intradiol ring-cleavage dioxygenase [Actinomycetota bacterium]